jgi:hypothetical protein
MPQLRTNGLWAVAAALFAAGMFAGARADSPPGQDAPGAGDGGFRAAQFGGFPGGGGGGGNFGGQQRGGGGQGGGFPGGGRLGMNPGDTLQVAAVCTDLLSTPPTSATRFTASHSGKVELADGRTFDLADAVRYGVIAFRGRDNSFDPVRRDGSLLLDLYVMNTAGVPVRVEINPGAQVTPVGQPPQNLPEGADRLFELGLQKRLALTNTMQYAVWAARGSTAEEVEQANMVRLAKPELDRVQSLLDASGIEREFDRARGAYAARYEEAVEKLADGASEMKGYSYLPTGARVQVEGVRTAEGTGYVAISNPKNGGEFFYRAAFTRLPDRRVKMELFHLVTGNPVRVTRKGLLLYPKGQAS